MSIDLIFYAVESKLKSIKQSFGNQNCVFIYNFIEFGCKVCKIQFSEENMNSYGLLIEENVSYANLYKVVLFLSTTAQI